MGDGGARHWAAAAVTVQIVFHLVFIGAAAAVISGMLRARATRRRQAGLPRGPEDTCTGRVGVNLIAFTAQQGQEINPATPCSRSDCARIKRDAQRGPVRTRQCRRVPFRAPFGGGA